MVYMGAAVIRKLQELKARLEKDEDDLARIALRTSAYVGILDWLIAKLTCPPSPELAGALKKVKHLIVLKGGKDAE